MRSLLLTLIASAALAQAPNLCPDPSVEAVQAPNQFGVPFVKWGGWKFEGDCRFEVGKVAHSGQHSAELIGGQGAKIRVYTPAVKAQPGRYRFRCWLRGLDLGVHAWNITLDFNFGDEQYMGVKRPGTFGWTQVEMVREVKQAGDIFGRVGLFAPGRLWVDDAEITKVPDDTAITAAPVFGKEEQPIEPPGKLDPARAVACAECGYRSLPEWKVCYACGEPLTARAAVTGPDTKPLASFEDGKTAPFDDANAAAVAEHATDGKWGLAIHKDWASWEGHQDWSGYDFLVADVFNPNDTPEQTYIEVRDDQTKDYWTRVNYNTVAPPGASTLLMPTDIYVGEKSRPGRPLDKAHVNRLVYAVGQPKLPLIFDNVRLQRDTSAEKVKVPGLRAFDFAPGTSPPFRGFELVAPGTTYSAGRGYGLKDAHLWRAFDVLQPDPLYQTFLCIESGGFAVDVPNGKWHVFVNLDSPSGFWGEVQTFRKRQVKANGKLVVDEAMDRDAFAKRYFRFADTEDSLAEATFDKYQVPYFHEKEFDADVTGGQLSLEFLGENWANCVSALVIYPAEQAEAGKQYLANLRERRRFWFDNYFKRIPPNGDRDAQGSIPAFAPSADETARGFAVFARDWMQNTPCNAVPRREQVTTRLDVSASAGEQEPIVFSLYPLKDAGTVTVSVSDLAGPAGRVPASAIQIGRVSHRVSRVTMEGSVYTIEPRFVLPHTSAELKQGTTTTFWLNLKVPNPVAAGTYQGSITLTPAAGAPAKLALSARLFATPLDEADLPIGPWGCQIGLPWYDEDMGDYPQRMLRKCLSTMRADGLTSFSGIPTVRLTGWKDKQPQLDFAAADRDMAVARECGFKDLILDYGTGIQGFENYWVDDGARQRSGFATYPEFLKAVLSAVDAHAKAANWLPVGWNLCDEPIGDAIARATANAQAWKDAAPPGLVTTGATSVQGDKPDNPHLGLAKALRIANVNDHDEAAIKAIQTAGGAWAFYNGGNRWTFGTYLFKCAKEYDCRFRLSWHWNASAGDPFYALDCREDDYSWYSANAAGELIPTIHYLREIREGLDDYRYLQTLARLCREKPDSPAASTGKKLLADKLALFKLGQREHDQLWPTNEYATFRRQVAEAIERFR